MPSPIASLFINFRAGTGTLEADLGKVQKSLGRFGRKMEQAGASLTKGITLPVAALGAASIKAAIDFESAFTGVIKTVNGTEKQFAALKTGIVSMSKQLPASTTEIAGVAEAAGQLGIQTDNILDFTKVMIDLGETTNLSAEQAATSLARLANITGLSQDKFSNLGSTIVALGNNLATTEAEITEMGLRLAGAGAQIGLSESEILSFGAALSSVGVAAEAGGTAFSRVFKELQLAVEDGGKSLDNFAKVAGVTTAQFKTNFQDNAATAVVSFIEGLNRIKEEGGSVLGTLETLGLDSIRVSDSLLRAAGAGNLFRDALSLGNTAWQENSALTKEAELRYGTMASQISIVGNKLKAIGVVIGSDVMPVVKKVTEFFARLTEKFSRLHPETRRALIVFAGIAAVVGPLALAVGALAAVFASPLVLGIGAATIAVAGLTAGWVGFAEKAAETTVMLEQDFLSILQDLKKEPILLWEIFDEMSKNVIRSVTEMVIGIEEWLGARFGGVFEGVRDEVNATTEAFAIMWNDVVGNSYVPDMVDAIGDWFGKLGNVMVKPAQQATGLVGRLFKDLATDTNNAFRGLISNLSNIAQGGGNILSGIFGSIGGGGGGGSSFLNGGVAGLGLAGIFSGGGAATTAAVQGPLTQAGASLQGLGLSHGAALGIGDFATSAAGVGGVVNALSELSEIGQSTEETVEGLTTALGAYAGSFFGPFGTLAGSALGDIIGDPLGSILGGSNGDPQADARREIESMLEQITGTDFLFGDRGRFEQPGWAAEWWETMGDESVKAFTSLGEGITNAFGIIEDIGPQIGFILSENLGGNIDRARILLDDLGLSVEQIDEQFVKLGESGEKSWYEVEVLLQGTASLAGPALIGVGDVAGALDLLRGSAGRGKDALRGLTFAAIETEEAGGKSLTDLENRIRETGQLTAQEIKALFDALANRGITSLDELKNANTRVLGGVIADMQSAGFAFDGFSESVDSSQGAIGELDSAIRRMGSTIDALPTSKTITFNIQKNVTETVTPVTANLSSSPSAGSGDAARVNRSLNFNVDARGAGPGTEDQVRAVMEQVVDQAAAKALTVIAEDQLR